MDKTLWFTHTMEYYSPTNMSKQQLEATEWMSLKITLREEN